MRRCQRPGVVAPTHSSSRSPSGREVSEHEECGDCNGEGEGGDREVRHAPTTRPRIGGRDGLVAGAGPVRSTRPSSAGGKRPDPVGDLLRVDHEASVAHAAPPGRVVRSDANRASCADTAGTQLWSCIATGEGRFDGPAFELSLKPRIPLPPAVPRVAAREAGSDLPDAAYGRPRRRTGARPVHDSLSRSSMWRAPTPPRAGGRRLVPRLALDLMLAAESTPRAGPSDVRAVSRQQVSGSRRRSSPG